MPELPEVQTVVNELSDELTGLEISSIEIISGRGMSHELLDIINFSVSNVTRRGKYIIFHGEHLFIVGHLRMTGKFVFSINETDEKHVRSVFNLSNKRKMYFIDVRKFGTIEVTKDIDSFFKHLGPEPFSDEFNSTYLKERFSGKIKPIKNALMDQHIVAGIGNIYADESLFLSKISPLKKSGELSIAELNLLVQNIIFIFRKSISNMGTTLSDYRTTKNIGGENQNYLNVYGLEGVPCKVCKNNIVRIKMAGRSTHYCPACQI